MRPLAVVIAPGAQFSGYTISSLLGKGGMGEVWRAHDPHLRRDVALKVVPDLFADDADRLARFEREAQLLASLNHPNIAQIYALERCGSIRALIIPAPLASCSSTRSVCSTSVSSTGVITIVAVDAPAGIVTLVASSW